MTTKKPASGGGSDGYRVPALEKGLDVLELLAAQEGGMTHSQVAAALGRSVQEIYRVVLALERRGYVERGEDDAFRLALRLFDLAVRRPPLRRLLDAAEPLLVPLAEELGQLVTLVVRDGSNLRVVAVGETSAAVGFRVRLGASRPLMAGASGRVLLAFRSANLAPPIVLAAPDQKRLECIRQRGGEHAIGELLRGIVDVSFPVIAEDGNVIAALTMPFLDAEEVQPSLRAAAKRLHSAASDLSKRFGGTQPSADELLAALDV